VVKEISVRPALFSLFSCPCKAHRLLYHSTLGLGVIQQKKNRPRHCQLSALFSLSLWLTDAYRGTSLMRNRAP